MDCPIITPTVNDTYFKRVKMTKHCTTHFPKRYWTLTKSVHPIHLITPSLGGVIISTSAISWAPTPTRVSTQRATGPTAIRSPQIFPHVATPTSFISPCATVVSIQERFWILTVSNQCWRRHKVFNVPQNSSCNTELQQWRVQWHHHYHIERNGEKKVVRGIHQHH